MSDEERDRRLEALITPRAGVDEIKALRAERDKWKEAAHVEAKGLRCAFRERAERAEAENERLRDLLDCDGSCSEREEALRAERDEARKSDLAQAIRASQAEAERDRLRVALEQIAGAHKGSLRNAAKIARRALASGE